MRHQLYRVGFIILVLFGLFAGSNPTFASVPPHPRVKKMLDEKKIPIPFYLQNRKELLQRGVNAPWASPEIQKQNLNLQSGIKRSLGPSKSPSGSYRALVLLVKFSDQAQSVDAVSFDSLLFGNSMGTMRNYYKAISYNQIDIVTVNMPSSVGWTMAPQTYDYYVNGQNGTGAYPRNSQKLVEDVIAAADSSVDFSKYDNDVDGFVDALFVVHTGPGAEFTGSGNDIWSHAWQISSPQVRDGVALLRYSIEPEYWAAPGDMTCGVYAHELGHAGFGLPDLYDTDYSSEGLGRWTLMAGGSWCGASGLGESPAFPDAWSQFQMGFLNPTNVITPLFDHSIHNAEDTSEAFRLWTNGSIGNQYFLVQNRQQVGYDSYIPGNGLLLYHVDESVASGNDNEWYPGHISSGHYLVALEQADGLYDLEKNINYGNTGDPYPGSTLNSNFASGTSPNSDDYTGASSKVSVRNISNSGSVMTADIQVGLVPGRPLIVVTPDTINFGTASVGYNKQDTVFIENGGADSLLVSGITSTLPEYTPSSTSFTVPAGGMHPVVITFAPTGPNTYNGTLTIASNDTSHATVQVMLRGNGEYPPAMTVTPDSFAVELVQNDSTVRTMTIGNTGAGVLNWNASAITAPTRIVNPFRDRSFDIIRPTTDPREMDFTSDKQMKKGVSLSTPIGNFYDGFEDGNFTEWDNNGTTGTKEVTSSTAAEGIYSFHYQNTTTGHGHGISRDFAANYRPEYVGFFVRTGSNSLASGYFRLDGNTSNQSVIWFSASNTGTFYINGDVGGDNSFAYTANRWYHVEFKNIDWVNKIFDYYVDNLLIKADIPFRNASIANQFGRLYLYNFDQADAWWDGIGMGIQTNWLTVAPSSGTITPGNSQTVNVKFDAKNLPGGNYRSSISITSNDPVNNPKNVPANLHVIGIPIISVVPDTVKAGTTFVGMNRVDTIRVRNIGSDSLTVTGILSNLPVFTTNITNFKVLPGNEQAVAVRFAPTDTLAYNGTLSITSNDALHPTLVIALQGRGAYPPAIIVSPDSFAVELFQNDSTLRTMTIGNTGTGNLMWSVNSTNVSNMSRVLGSVSSMKSHIIRKRDRPKSKSISGEVNVDPQQTSEEAVKVYLKPAYAPSSGGDIAILGSDGSGGSYLTNVAAYLNTAGKFNSVTTINGFSITPTLTELQAFNAVVVFAWSAWSDSAAIGNLLANYIDAGGNVLVAFAANYSGISCKIGGRFHAANYWLIRPNIGNGGTVSSLGTILHPEHQIMSGISTVASYSKLNSGTTITPTATCLANFTDGTPLIAIDESMLGRRADISFPVITTAINSTWGIDTTSRADELIVNAVEWLSAGDKWLSFVPASGIVTPSAQQNVSVKFKAKNMLGGNYRSIISVVSNDPVNSMKTVPANLHVIGIPAIAVVPDTLKAGTTFIGMNRVDTIRIMNIGTDLLNITNITSNVPVFTTTVTNFSVVPGREQAVAVRFAPTDTISYNGTLTITSNDSVHTTVQVMLKGKGEYPPVITVTPDSLMVTLAQNDSTVKTMTIENTGLGVLNWSINPAITDSITTTFTGGNSQNGNMFDITAINTITITGFDVHPEGNTNYEIYYKSGTYVGFENDSAVWMLAASFSEIVAQPFGTPTPLPRTLSILVPAGQTYGFYITSSNVSVSQNYTNGTAVGQVYRSDVNLQVKEGCGLAYPFSGSPFTPRIWNGRIYYAKGTKTKNPFWSALPSSGTVAPSSNQSISVNLNAKDLPGGDYQSLISITSNDPMNSPKNIPVNLHVIGRPLIDVIPDTLKFNPAYVGIQNQDTIFIRNVGSVALEVNSITVSDTAFHPNKTSFVVAPGGQDSVLVRFTPSTAGAIVAAITITNNDSSALTKIVPIRGEKVYPPVIHVSPDSLIVKLARNDSTTRTVTIENTGTGSLLWSAKLQDQGMSPLYKKYLEKLHSIPFVAESKGQRMNNAGPRVEFSMGGPDSAGYRWIDSDQPGGPTFNWTDIKGIGTLISLSGDDFNTGPLPIGFDFTFYGNVFSQFRICTNGWISFTSSLTTFSNCTLPKDSATAPENLIAAFWDDLEFNSDRAFYYNDGTKLTIQYDSVQRLGIDSSKYTFQIILYPGGDIKLQYLTMVGDVSGSTVGIQNQTRTIGLTVVYNAAYLHDSLAILFSKTPAPFFSLSPTSGTILSGQSQSVTVKFNAKGLLDGEYRSVISVTSNDPVSGSKLIPMTLTVDSTGTVTGVTEKEPVIPKEFALHQNYPNPFNPSTTIEYALPARSRVKLQIYNILGQMVTELVSTEQNAGYQSVIWNATVASGIYFYRIEAKAIQNLDKTFVNVKKMLLLK